MAARLTLESPNSSKATRILIYLNHNYKKYKFTTGEKIVPKFWNSTKLMARANYKENSELNTRLKDLVGYYEEALKKLILNQDEVNRENILEAVRKIHKSANYKPRKKAIKRENFFSFIEQFISDCETGKRLINGKRYSNYTIKGYKVTKNHLLRFQEESRTKISFATLDKDFYDSFIAYFYNKEVSKGKDENNDDILQTGHTINSVGKHIKNLKVFANHAADKGITIHPDFFRKNFKVLAEDTDQVALTIDELKAIEDVQLDNQKLDHVRDCFLLASYTGLRFSDLLQLTSQNINGEMLKVTTQKTGQKVVIPLHRTVKAILDKHNGIPPTPYSNQKMNEYLKEVCQKAGLTALVTASKTRAGAKDTVTVPKYTLVTVHTARRSFATNLYLAGMDILTIKKMTGHHTEKSFLKYIRVSEEENAEKAAKHAFFQ